MGTKIQEWEASWDMSRAFRQFQRADKSLTKDNSDTAVKHLKKGLHLFSNALNHIAKAEEDAYKKAGEKIDAGNKDLQKSIDEYSNGENDRGARHYDDAMNSYDEALDIVN
jgi:hypothetical protein